MEVDPIEDEIDGLIISVHVKNFFCHENLVVTFNPNINFIVGRNGSGKSAILTALVVGLGARASTTNRGLNLQSFVRKGANSASIEIKIKNNSRNAYKHEIYGDSITVVRKITSTGNSSYRIKNDRGAVISTKSAEVSAITLALDIQVDNPISVLNQDDARSFHASDAKKKYLLYRRATNLDKTESNYQAALENCSKAKIILQHKKEVCKDTESQVKVLEVKYNKVQSHDEMEQRRRKLQNEYFWSEIMELEKDCQKLELHSTQCERRVQELTETSNNIKTGSDDTLNDINAEIAKLTDQKSVLDAALREFEQLAREEQMKIRTIDNNIKQQLDSYNREEAKYSIIEQEIEKISSGGTASRRKSLSLRAKSTEEAALAAKARCNTAHNDKVQAQKNSLHATQAVEEVASRLRHETTKLNELKGKLRELQNPGGDALALYGQNMVELCRRVKEATARGLFSAPPRGPVGAYLKAKEKKWASALEHILGRNIQSFCVNTNEDSRKLFEIMNQVYGSSAKPSVTCSQFINRRHDVRRNCVRAAGYVSALDALDIPDPIVANFLIDNISVETILLVPEHGDAIRLSDSVENVPAHCTKIVTLDNTEFHPAPNYRSYGGAHRPSRYLQISRVERVRQLQAEIEGITRSVASLGREQAALVAKAREADAVEKKASEVAAALYIESHSKETACKAARAALEESQKSAENNALFDQLEDVRQSMQALDARVQDLRREAEVQKSKVAEMEDAIGTKRRDLGLVNGLCNELNEKLALNQINIERNILEKRNIEEKIKESRSKLERATTALNEKKSLIQQKTKAALKLCPKIDEPREKSIVIAELKKTEQTMKSLHDSGMSKEELYEQFQAIQKVYRKTKKELDTLEDFIAKVERTANKHLKFCYVVQKSIARKVQYNFQSVLSMRKYLGRMEIDSASGTLDLCCSGRKRARGEEGRVSSTSALSGGERSYATVAFIMALWECAELPFCFMDEFDVFMDNVNRKMVMDLLIEHALQHRSRQFVFLTPQDASTLVAGEHIKIHRWVISLFSYIINRLLLKYLYLSNYNYT